MEDLCFYPWKIRAVVRFDVDPAIGRSLCLNRERFLDGAASSRSISSGVENSSSAFQLRGLLAIHEATRDFPSELAPFPIRLEFGVLFGQ